MKGHVFIALLYCVSWTTQSATLTVSGQANIFGAGKSVPPAPGGGGGGILPPVFTFEAGPNNVVVFTTVNGTIEGAPGSYSGPEGVADLVNALPYDGISGIQSPVAVPLAGVFLGPDEPHDPAPASLDFRDSGLGLDFAQLSPLIGQLFIIGDGLTGSVSGTLQIFHVPATAARLFLGVFDGYHINDGVGRLPGYYGDNGGAYYATFQLFALPVLNIVRGDGQVVLHYSTEPDVYYQVQATDLDSGPAWTPLGDAVMGDGQPGFMLRSTTNVEHQFYRLVAHP